MDYKNSSQGQRTENLDVVGHYNGVDWSLSYIMDGYTEANPHYVHQLSENINNALLEANEPIDIVNIINNAMNKNKSIPGKACIVLVFCKDSKMTIYSAGDSRAYIPNQKFKTQDHTLLQRHINSGKIPLDKACNHPIRKILCNSISAASDFSNLQLQCETDIQDVILCTDGFWSILNNDPLLDIKSYEDLERVFMSNSYTDNATVAYFSQIR